jgi:hypothetical protein
MLLDLWSSGSDGVRIACFLNIRKIVAAADESIKDMVLKVRHSLSLLLSQSPGPPFISPLPPLLVRFTQS